MSSSLVRRELSETEIEEIAEQSSTQTEDIEGASLRDLLVRAERLYAVKDPASVRISRIKDAILSRVNPTYDDNNQLLLFDNVNGYAYLNPDDQQEIIVSHPDTSIQLRVKKTKITNWKMVNRSIADELARVTALRENILAKRLEDRTTDETHNLISLTSRSDTLRWVIEQTNNKVYNREQVRFTSVVTDKA